MSGTHDHSGGAGLQAGKGDHEQSDINLRAILISVVVLVVVAATLHVLVWVLLEFFAGQRAQADPPVAPLAAPAGQLPPEPRLQRWPREDLKAYLVEEDAALAGEPAGTVRPDGVHQISIERAKELILPRGLPSRPGAPPASQAVGATLRDTSSGRLPAATGSGRGLGPGAPKGER